MFAIPWRLVASENSSPRSPPSNLSRTAEGSTRRLDCPSEAADDPEMAARVISPWNLTANAKLKSMAMSSSIAANPHSLQGRPYCQTAMFIDTPLVLSLGAKAYPNDFRRSKIVSATTDSSKSSAEPSNQETSKAETTVTGDQAAPPPHVQLEANGRAPSSSNSENPMPRRPSLTVREKLRAARVLSKYMESKPAKEEFGSRVLEASRESDKGRKSSGLPEAPTNLFDDSKRGLPQPGWTFEFPFQGDIFFIIFSFVFISTVMLATTFIVWKSGAIHFNEY